MAAPRRDDFTKKTVDLLARRSGGRCSICGCTTWGPNDKPYSATNIGQAAHITAAAPGGPRYDPSMSPEARSSIRNGIWLCSNCHDKVDRNPDSYPVKDLRRLKIQAEERAKRELGVATLQGRGQQHEDHPLDFSVSGVAIIEVRKLKAQLITYHSTNQKAPLNELISLLNKLDFIDFKEPYYLPPVAAEVVHFLQLLVGYHDDPSLKLEVIRYLGDVMDHLASTLEKGVVQEICQTLESLATRCSSPRQPVYQSALALLKDISRKMAARDPPTRKIAMDAMERVARQQTGRGRGRNHLESVDYGSSEDDEDDDNAKYPRLEDSNDVKYIQKMIQLAAGWTQLQPQDEEEIEREITDLGFEPNIL